MVTTTKERPMMTYEEFRTLKAAHDHAVELGATCPDDCKLRAPVYIPVEHSTAPPAADFYRDALALRTAAERTPEQFEADYKAERLRDLNLEHQRFATHSEANPFPRFTAAELADYSAPDPYAAGLKALREGRHD